MSVVFWRWWYSVFGLYYQKANYFKEKDWYHGFLWCQATQSFLSLCMIQETPCTIPILVHTVEIPCYLQTLHLSNHLKIWRKKTNRKLYASAKEYKIWTNWTVIILRFKKWLWVTVCPNNIDGFGCDVWTWLSGIVMLIISSAFFSIGNSVQMSTFPLTLNDYPP